MVDRKVIQEWLGKADEDFNFACRNVEDEENTFYAQICFHFQQAAEKYLKAYIVAYELTFKKIHELPELVKICRGDNDSFSELEEGCNFLTDFVSTHNFGEKVSFPNKEPSNNKPFRRSLLKNSPIL